MLHTHLPYVLHHGKWPHGSDWLSEAVAESYLPILGVLKRLQTDGIRAKLSMDFSPVLLEQLADEDFPEIFVAYCNEKISLAEADYDEFFRVNTPEMRPLALYWHSFYTECKRAFQQDYGSDMLGAFRHFSDTGILDAMTCGATHGYFPLLLDDRNVRAQLRLAIATHEKYFGKTPRGLWLPECGYRPHMIWSPPVGDEAMRENFSERLGIEELLSEVGLEYFVVEGTLTKGGAPMRSYFQLFDSIHDDLHRHIEWQSQLQYFREHGSRSLADVYGVHSSYSEMPENPPLVFSRDRKTSEQVWSGSIGYPGDPKYLEFHKKHHNSGLRYWSVTSTNADLADKVLYDPESVDVMLDTHAKHFVELVRGTLSEHRSKNDALGIVCSPFDTELFGHWWFEGPRFLGKVMERLDGDPDVRLIHCADAVDSEVGSREVISMPEGSWGEGGGNYVWLNSEVEWMWEKIYPLEERFLQLTDRYIASRDDNSDFAEKVYAQTARELLFMEASDWQFNITTEGSPDYARERFHEHVDKLTLLLDLLERLLDGTPPDEGDLQLLAQCKEKDRAFSQIKAEWWGKVNRE